MDSSRLLYRHVSGGAVKSSLAGRTLGLGVLLLVVYWLNGDSADPARAVAIDEAAAPRLDAGGDEFEDTRNGRRAVPLAEPESEAVAASPTTCESGGASSSGPWSDDPPSGEPELINVIVQVTGAESPAFLEQATLLDAVLRGESELGVFEERRMTFIEDPDVACEQFVEFIGRSCDLSENERQKLTVFGRQLHADLRDALQWSRTYSGQTGPAPWDGGPSHDRWADVARFAIDVEQRRQLLDLIAPLCDRREAFIQQLLPPSKLAARRSYWENDGISVGITL